MKSAAVEVRLDSHSVDEALFEEHWCRDHMHSTCLHVVSDTVDWGMDDRSILRDPGQADLCRCPCHQDCPLSDQSTGLGWPERCLCNGTHHFFRLRSRQDFDLREVISNSIDESRRRSKARSELRQRARGLSSEQIDGLIDRIWSAHGLPLPHAPARPTLVDWALHPPTRLEELKVNLDVLHGMGKGISNIVGMIRKSSQGLDIGESRQREAFQIEASDDSLEVALNADAQGRLSSMTDRAIWQVRMLTPIVVSLRTGSDGGLEVWEWEPEPLGLPAELGHLSPEQSTPWLPYVWAAERVGQVATCRASRAGAPNNYWRLYVRTPYTPPAD